MPTSPKQQPLIKRLFGFGRKNSVRSSSREPSRDERRGSKEYARASYDDTKSRDSSRSKEHYYDEKHHRERESRHRSSSQHPRPSTHHHHRSSRHRERRLSY